jgi:hypothetical protein
VTEVKLTPEQIQERQKFIAIREKISYQWLQNHLNDYVPNQHNADLIEKYIAKHNLVWSTESLEFVFGTLKDEFTDTPAPRAIAPAPVAKPGEEQPPWGVLTAASVKAMGHSQYKEFYYSPKWGERFKKEVDALKLTKSQVR